MRSGRPLMSELSRSNAKSVVAAWFIAVAENPFTFLASVPNSVRRSSLTGFTIAIIPRSLQETYRQNQRRTPYGLVVNTDKPDSMFVPIGTCPFPSSFVFILKEETRPSHRVITLDNVRF